MSQEKIEKDVEEQVRSTVEGLGQFLVTEAPPSREGKSEEDGSASKREKGESAGAEAGSSSVWEERQIVGDIKVEKPPRRGLRGEFRSLVLVGIPTYGMIDADFLVNMITITTPVNTTLRLHVVRGKPVDVACNEIVEKALELNSKYVYFREDDVLTPPGALERLFAVDEDIVAAVCCSKQKPPFPIVFREYGGGPYTGWYDKVGIPVQVVGTGLGATLIRTDVFREIPKPWFKTISGVTEICGVKIDRMTQDLYFCFKALRYGFDIWVDTGTLCAHKDVYTGTIYFFDPILKLPAWIEEGDTKARYGVPAKRHKRAQPLTVEEKEKALREFLPSVVSEFFEGTVFESEDEGLVIRVPKEALGGLSTEVKKNGSICQ